MHSRTREKGSSDSSESLDHYFNFFFCKEEGSSVRPQFSGQRQGDSTHRTELRRVAALALAAEGRSAGQQSERPRPQRGRRNWIRLTGSWWHGEEDGRNRYGRPSARSWSVGSKGSKMGWQRERGRGGERALEDVSRKASRRRTCEARALSEGSMMPPRRRRTRWRVDSFCSGQGQV